MDDVVAVRQVVKRFGTFTALAGVSLTIGHNQFFTLLGPSGCGKTTLLRCIAGFEDVTEGTILLDGRDIARLAPNLRPVNTVFQHYALFPHMTVAENLLFAVPAFGTNGTSLTNAQRQARVQQALQEAELTGMGERDPSTLSGGQRARVALMRALLAEPQALLLDEPFSKLDAALRAQLRPWVFAHVRERRIPVVLVTHDEQDVADPQRVVHLRAATEESTSHV